MFNRILQNRWQYFYKSQVLRGFSPGASDQPIPVEDQPDHAHQLLAILNAYGQALVQIIDPHITQKVLASLQCLHERWKLFGRDFFKTNLLELFLNTLLKLLISPNGILHQDQLINVLFNMSQVDVYVLGNAFVGLGYEPKSKFIHDICSAKVRFLYSKCNSNVKILWKFCCERKIVKYDLCSANYLTKNFFSSVFLLSNRIFRRIQQRWRNLWPIRNVYNHNNRHFPQIFVRITI